MLACTLAAALGCAACSPGAQEPATPASSASSPGLPATQALPAGAMTTAGPAAATTVAKPVASPIYLFDLLQRADFRQALDALPGAQALPAWVRQGGTATPVRIVRLDGKPMLLATACKPHDCPTERVALLYDAQDHAMWGLFAQRPENLTPAVDPDDSSQDKLNWLGGPDQARQRLLHDALYVR
ncbi:Ivy family c-type lysozyme inhibitor [Rhodanobacter geophilus]|uniref:Ivy family c-type lysozyme inhibitor n=1 Tax=Rhodanobacter geophilus TaxID=3162488 RepID=A0ABV3QLN4_9GAMM